MRALCITVCVALAISEAARVGAQLGDPLDGPLELPVEPMKVCTPDTFFEATSKEHLCSVTMYRRKPAGEYGD